MSRHGLRALRWLSTWVPNVLRVDATERWRASLGAALGILVAAVVSRWIGAELSTTPWLAAPLGASAVLVFAVPSSPLAQPWSVIGGNTASALVGVACARWIGDVPVAAALAVSLAIAMMFVLRCLHPPGGATALLAVLTHATTPGFAALPILLNSVLLVGVGIFFNTATGRRYPRAQAARSAAPLPAGSRFTAADLDAALAHYNQVLDVSRADLETLLHQAEAAAYKRNLGELTCRDIMSPDPVVVHRTTTIAQARELMRSHRVKALPVIDATQRVIGIVTRANFQPTDAVLSLAEQQAQSVGGVMTRRVRVASADSAVLALLPLFSESGHHHLPIIDTQARLAGVITQSDLVRALHRAVQSQ